MPLVKEFMEVLAPNSISFEVYFKTEVAPEAEPFYPWNTYGD